MARSVDVEFGTVAAMVERALNGPNKEKCRRSDKWLLYEVWREQAKIYIPFSQIEELPMPETIRRTRQKFNEQGLYLPSDKVVRKRRERQEDVRRWSRQTKLDGL